MTWLRRPRSLVFQFVRRCERAFGGATILQFVGVSVRQLGLTVHPGAIVFAAAIVAGTLAGTRTHAQEQFPVHAIRLIVPFPPGGTADTLPRIIAEKLRQKWNQPVVIENRSGAGGNIGAEVVSKSAPDGYTLLASPPGPIVINETLYKTLPYAPSDFIPVIVLGTVPNVLAVRSNFPAGDAREFVAYVKSHPGAVTFASQGIGSTSHLTGVLFQRLTDTQMLHVPYRGTAPALQDLLAKNVDVFFDNLASSRPLNDTGQIRILAVGSATRAPSLPDVPTLREDGVNGFSSVTWFALMAPAHTPTATVAKLNETINGILKEPDVQHRLAQLGIQAMGGDIGATAKFIADERARWSSVVKFAHVTIQ